MTFMVVLIQVHAVILGKSPDDSADRRRVENARNPVPLGILFLFESLNPSTNRRDLHKTFPKCPNKNIQTYGDDRPKKNE
jgi:hypothetical protein